MLLLRALLPLAAFQGQASTDGYWQQHVGYEITASLDEAAGVLAGHQRVTYRNRAPDTLHTISFHLYLNAFRPGSRWAEADAAEGRHRFDRLQDPDYAYLRIASSRIGGLPATPIYPFAPDSTIVRFVLPEPLGPGDTVSIALTFESRLSTVPRRQGRRGRHYDFAHWYPRVVVYDRLGWQEHPLYPAGEFYGEFAEYSVTLNVPDDQVMGATGVLRCGDPGWTRANRTPGLVIDYRRGAYLEGGEPPSAETLCAERRPGRKQVAWYARAVHDFAMTMNPEYRYEGGAFGDVGIHVLYQPGDEATWGGGIVVRNTQMALRWLHDLFGPYPWPQMTVVHRIENGGTEFPMMQMNGSPSLGLNLHEGGHNYLMGILANNEWREGWLDEGFTSFQTTWFFEERGTRGAYEALEARILGLELDGMAEPVSMPAEHYRDFATYGQMVYGKGQLFLHQLRELVGEPAMRRILRLYFERWKLRHVDEHAFRAVAEEVSGRDLSGFFAEWLHGTTLVDYALDGYGRTRQADGTWRTRVTVRRKSPGRFPVEVRVVAEGDTAAVRVEGQGERETVTLVTRTRPRRVEVDPRRRSHDWNYQNNDGRWGALGLRRRGSPLLYLDRYVQQETRRDRRTLGLAPSLWYNDTGGLTVGVRARSDYFGRYDQRLIHLSWATGAAGEDAADRLDVRGRYRNPSWWRAPGLRQELELFRQEGRSGIGLALGKSWRPHLGFGPEHDAGIALRWVATHDFSYLDPSRWDNGGTIELTLHRGVEVTRGSWSLAARTAAGLGVMYDKEGAGLGTEERFDGQAYGRFSGEMRAAWTTGPYRAAGRLWGGLVASDDPVVQQRQFFLAGADPYEILQNPFLRSRGALLAGSDIHYHAPGGAGIRGLAGDVKARAAVALNVELERTLWSRGTALANRIGLALFGDVALADDEPAKGPILDRRLLADAGIGFRIDHRVGTTPFTTRLDLPLYVSEPSLAQDRGPGRATVGFRWLVGLERPF